MHALRFNERAHEKDKLTTDGRCNQKLNAATKGLGYNMADPNLDDRNDDHNQIHDRSNQRFDQEGPIIKFRAQRLAYECHTSGLT